LLELEREISSIDNVSYGRLYIITLGNKFNRVTQSKVDSTTIDCLHWGSIN